MGDKLMIKIISLFSNLKGLFYFQYFYNISVIPAKAGI